MLAAALVLAAVLAYQALDAARTHRAAAERALRDYAAFSAGELARRTQGTLEAAVVTAQYMPIAASEGRGRDVPLVPVAEFADTVRAQDFWCECLGRARDFFRMEFPSSAAEWTGALPAAARAEVQRIVAARADSLDGRTGDRKMNLYGEMEGKEKAGSYQMRTGQTDALVRTVGGKPMAVMFTLVFDPRNRARGAYGVALDPAFLVGQVAPRVLDRRPLLPPSLTGGLPNDSLLSVRIEAPGGALLYSRGGDFDPRYAAADTFRGAFAGIVTRVALRPLVAEKLLIGGLPRSRIPLVLALLTVTAGLVVVSLLQMRRQNELARLRADFVSGVSHELRTPLTQIRMFAELLAGGRLRTEEERARSARLIDQEARRLTYLVENVLDFSRAARGTGRIIPEPTDLSAAVRETVESFAPIARSRGVALRTVLDEGLVATVDRGALRQIFLNFLDNAVKYGPAGQTVAVGAVRAGGAARVFVQDEGPGVPAADRARVWEPYTRLDREQERVSGGSGIGLAVVRDLARLHGGRAWVEEGADGRGARFVAELPLGEMGDEDREMETMGEAPHREPAEAAR
jgi:signal transduction histidine kinase